MSDNRKGRLEGRVAVVTGGAGGIGKAICDKMINEGAKVALLDIREAELLETCRLFSRDRKPVMGLIKESAYITGQTLFVCGGLSIYSSPI